MHSKPSKLGRPREPRRRAQSALALIATCTLAICALAICALGTPKGIIAKAPAELATATAQADLDGNGGTDYMRLQDGRLSIYGSDGKRYLSPKGWAIEDAHAIDLDGDGGNELALIVWNGTFYGTSKPFWIEHETPGLSRHVYVMRYSDGQLAAVWMSSALGDDAAAVEIDEAGTLRITDTAGQLSTWTWGSWGYVLADEGNREEGQPQQERGSSHGKREADKPAGSGDAAVTLLAVGDNIMHGSICASAYDDTTRRFNFTPLYEHVRNRISAYDLAAVCQETILVEERSAIGDFPDFGTPVEAGEALYDAGFDIVVAATNHAFDQGAKGVQDTLGFWRANHPDVALLGLHDDPAESNAGRIVESGGMSFALFDATYGLNGHALPTDRRWLVDTLDDADELAGNIERADGLADITVCFLHIGEEYAEEPTAFQHETVQRMTAAGADLVICSHPHVVQPAELVEAENGNQAVVFWSLGNFASNQSDVRTMLGGAASVSFARDAEGQARIASYELLPTVCHFTEHDTAVYFLEDYTDELAAAHYLSTAETPLSVASLASLWNELTTP